MQAEPSQARSGSVPSYRHVISPIHRHGTSSTSARRALFRRAARETAAGRGGFGSLARSGGCKLSQEMSVGTYLLSLAKTATQRVETEGGDEVRLTSRSTCKCKMCNLQLVACIS